MKLEYNIAVWLLAAWILAACAVTPKNPEQIVYATYGTYVVVVESTADLLNQGLISKSRAIEIQKKTQEIRPTLDAAMNLARLGKPVGDDLLSTIQKAQVILLEIQKTLQGIKP